MTSDEKIDGLDAIVEELVEWELATMDYESLQEFWVNNMTDFYKDNPKALGDMLDYMKECTDPSVDFYWDVEKKDNTDQGDIYSQKSFREVARLQDNDMVTLGDV